jgi:hypothetical protein
MWKFLLIAAPVAVAAGAMIWYVSDPAAKA